MNGGAETKSAAAGGVRQLLGLAWPVILSRATQAVLGFSDALMVAPLGESSLAAASTGALNAFAFMILPMGCVFIVQSFAAQLRGRGETAALPRYAWYGLGIALAAGVCALLVVPAVPWILSHFSYEPAVHALMAQYLAIRLLSMLPAVGTEALGNWYGGLGNTRVGMVAGVVTMVTDLAGNYLLIEPRFGLPGYGVAGAAWASTAGSMIGFLVILVAFLRGYGYDKAAVKLVLRAREFARVLRFGLPNGVNWFLEFAAFVLFINVPVAKLGTTVLAAFNVVMQINSIAFMPAFGLSSAGAILVGEAIGRRAHVEVWPIVRRTASVAAGWMASVGLLYLVNPGWLMSLFAPRGVSAESMVAAGVTMLGISVIWQVFDAIAMALSEALRAAGDTTWCMFARIVLAWFVFTPAAWSAVLLFQGGVVTIMLALSLYIAALALVFSLRFASGRWKRIALVEEPQLELV